MDFLHGVNLVEMLWFHLDALPTSLLIKKSIIL